MGRNKNEKSINYLPGFEQLDFSDISHRILSETINPQALFNVCFHTHLKLLCNLFLAGYGKHKPPPGIGNRLEDSFSPASTPGTMLAFLKWCSAHETHLALFPIVKFIKGSEINNTGPFSQMVLLRNLWVHPKDLPPEDAFEKAKALWLDFLKSGEMESWGKFIKEGQEIRWISNNYQILVGSSIFIDTDILAWIESFDPNNGQVRWQSISTRTHFKPSNFSQVAASHFIWLRVTDTVLKEPCWTDLSERAKGTIQPHYDEDLTIPSWFDQWLVAPKPGILIDAKNKFNAVQLGGYIQQTLTNPSICFLVDKTALSGISIKGIRNPLPSLLAKTLGYQSPFSPRLIKGLTGDGKLIVFLFSGFPSVERDRGRIFLKTAEYLSDMLDMNVRFILFLEQSQARYLDEHLWFELPEEFISGLYGRSRFRNRLEDLLWTEGKLRGFFSRCLKFF